MDDINPLSELKVIGVRHRGFLYAGPEHAALDRYLNDDLYSRAGVPYTYCEPLPTENPVASDPAAALGDLCGVIAAEAAAARERGMQLLMTGGNCSHAPGILGGLQAAHGPGARVGLVWFDAHGDFNTPRTTITGSLGGMPVAVCAGLAYPSWRERSGILAPIPTNRIVLWDMRNLDPDEKSLIHATDAKIARLGSPKDLDQSGAKSSADGAEPEIVDMETAVEQLASDVDLIYLHIDADILDAEYVPHHGTIESGGPSMDEVLGATEIVFSTGKVAALALVSVYFGGEAEKDVESGTELLSGALSLWRRYGTTVAT